MEEDFPYVVIPEEALPAIGTPDPGTRLYRTWGPEEGSGPWFEAMTAIVGPTVSPGGASMFAPVSRAAVHKRIKEGKLSAFCFHVESTRASLFGKQRKKRNTPYVYIPASELKAWAVELEDRIVRLGRITREELEGRKPDWEGEFWGWYSKWRKQQFKAAGKEFNK
ncbi:MAG: hypothetical protein MI807_20275 [Verrucomicrobiales bacterium]|nr:hypothetical protein [Verrucomicrobiales bacterium]